MNENLKRLLTFLVAASMVFSMLPMNAWADSSGTLDPEESVGPRDPAVSAGAAVKSFTVQPVSVIEGTCGVELTDENGQPYYQYSWDQAVDFAVVMTDGTTYTGPGGFTHNDVNYCIGYVDDQGTNHWQAGGSYTGTLILQDENGNTLKTAQTTVTVTASPVESIAFLGKVVLAKNTSGNYCYDDSGREYFHYNWQEQMGWTVYYKDGSSNTSTGAYVEYGDQNYYINCKDPQNADNPWGIGTYEVEATFMGKTATLTVQIVESIIADIALEPLNIMPHSAGGISTDENGAYFEYNWLTKLRGTITFIDGSTSTFDCSAGDYFWHNGIQYWFSREDNQSSANQWTAGNTYTGSFSVLGYTEQVSVTIRESPLGQLTIPAITVYENTLCSMRDEFDPDGNQKSYLHYEWLQKAALQLVFKDGTPYETSGNGVFYEGEYYYCHVIDGQSYDTPWTKDNTYNVTVYLMGKTVTVPVTIAADPIRDVVVPPVSIKENTGGSWWQGPEGQSYFYYMSWSDSLYLTVYFTDGCTYTGPYWGINHHGEQFSASVGSTQNYDAPWLAGNTYNGYVEIFGKQYDVPVTIYREVNTDGYTYMVQNEQAVITDCNLQQEVLEIPGVLGGYPVTGLVSLGEAVHFAKTVILPDSVTMLSDGAFDRYWWESEVTLEQLVLGKGITRISLDAVRSASHLKSICVAADHSAFSSVDGVLYTKDMTEMVIYPCAKTETHQVPDTVQNIDVIFDNRDIYENISFRMGAGVEGYVMENGVIYTENKTRIVMVTDGLTGSYVMPESVTAITPRAFVNSKVTSVQVSKNVATITYAAFAGCEALENVTLPEGVGWIGSFAFAGCESLESVTFPSTVKAVYDCAYDDCSALQFVSDTSLEHWMSIRFTDMTANPLYYGNDLYLNGQKVTELVIPDTVTRIYDAAFAGISVDFVSIPQQVYSIGNFAFAGASIRNVALSEGLDSIGVGAFSDSSLIGAVLPESLTDLGMGAFYGCSAMEYVYFGSNIHHIGDSTFAEAGLKFVTIPEHIYEIGYRAFYGSELEAVDFQSASLVIGEQAFAQSALKGMLVLGDNVRMLDWGAFQGTDITNVVISSSVTALTYKPFGDCDNLVSVTIPAELVELWDQAFAGSDNLSHVLYGGSPQQWQELCYYNSALSDAIVHCNASNATVETELTCSKVQYVCSICNEVVEVPRKDPAHEFDDEGVCTICGHDSYWEYDVDDHTGEVTITGYSLGINDLVIPSEIKGKPVVAIAPRAFENRQDILSVVIPNSVYYVGEGAFRNCEWLSNVTLSSNLTRIDAETFFRCNWLTDVEWQEGLEEIGPYAFSQSALTELVLPSTVKVVYDGAFADCIQLETLKLNEGLETVGNFAFGYCGNLTQMNLPTTVTGIGYYAFEFTGIRELTVPAGLQDIAVGAFGSCYDLQKIWFLGDAVEVGDIFTQIWATVYYSAFNPTWQEFVKTAGNDMNWCALGLAPFVVQPQNADTAAGGTLTVTAQAQGEGLTYQWYCAAPGSNAFVKTDKTGTTFTMTVNGENSGSRVYCEVTDRLGQVNRSKTVTLKITQEQTGIRVRRAPYTVEYALYQQLRLSGLEIVKTYTDGSEVLTQDYTCTGYDPNVSGEQTVTVTSGGYTATFTVTVAEEKVNYTASTPTEEKIQVNAPQNAVQTGAQLVVEKVEQVEEEIDEVPEIIQQNQSVVFDIAFVKDEQTVQPEEAVEVSIPVPEHMDSKSCKVFHVADDGQVQDMNAVYSDGHLVFLTDHFSYYAVVEMAGVRISGTVTGHSLIGVVVKLLSGEEVIESVEPLDGTYCFENVVDNDYVIEVEQEGREPKRYNISVSNIDQIFDILLGMLLGDVDLSGGVDVEDVVALLLHVSMPDLFEISGDADFDHSGLVDVDDVVTLLLHVSMPDLFPLN